MSRLITKPNVDDADSIYERLVELHRDKSAEESLVIQSRLIMLLINHVGDRDAVLEAIALAGRPNAAQ